jgi:hypothetical protein
MVHDVLAEGCSRSPHNDFPCHFRVHRTVVEICAEFCEGVGKAVVGIECFGFENVVVACHEMRNVIVIGPGNCSPHRDCQFTGEVVDFDFRPRPGPL